MAFGYSLSMRVTVLFFGVLKEMLSSESQTIELPPGATVDAVLSHYSALLPQQPRLWSSLAIAVNQSYAPSGCLLRDGDEVALLPPVSGGSEPLIALVTEPIDATALVAGVKQGEDGAVVVFDGIVRNNTRGRRNPFPGLRGIPGDGPAPDESPGRRGDRVAWGPPGRHGASPGTAGSGRDECSDCRVFRA